MKLTLTPSHLCLLAVALLASPSAQAQSGNGEMDIGIRSGIDTAEKEKRDTDPAYAQDPAKRLRVFFLASVKEEVWDEKLVHPVDAHAIAKDLTAQLIAQGFHPMQPDQKPEIVITVKYGRGFLPNPYLDSSNVLGGERQKQHTNLSNSDTLGPWQMHANYVGLEEKRQRAKQEQLIIQVRAWEYDPDPAKKQKMVWMTTMHVDDPEHRDLNEISTKMLAAGAHYFDRHMAWRRRSWSPLRCPRATSRSASPRSFLPPSRNPNKPRSYGPKIGGSSLTGGEG